MRQLILCLRQLLARGNSDARLLNVGLEFNSFNSRAPCFGRVLRAFLDAFAPRRTRFIVRSEGSPVLLAANNDQEPWNLVEALELDAPYALTEGVSRGSCFLFPLLRTIF
jgi:hypothetical protein